MSFYLILEKAQIHNKREFWFNSAEVKFLSFVSDGSLSLPELDDLKSLDSKGVRTSVRGMAQNILNKWHGVEVQNVQSDHYFEFGDTGKILFKSGTIPNSLDWIMLVMEMDQDVRTLGENIEAILPDEQVDSLSSNLLTMLGKVASPQTAAVVAISKALMKGITFFLKKNENDQLGIIEQSFIKDLHYPNGRRTAAGVGDLSGNMWYDYTIFGQKD